MSELYVFSPNGKIYNCPQACDNDKLKVGEYWPTVNIIQNTIQERHAFSVLKIDTCKECSLAPICGGGCYIKRIHSPETICYKSDLINSLKYILKKILQMNTKSLES